MISIAEKMLASAIFLLISALFVHMHTIRKQENPTLLVLPRNSLIPKNESGSWVSYRNANSHIEKQNLLRSAYLRTTRQVQCTMAPEKLSKIKQLLNDQLSQIPVEWETCHQMESITCVSWLKMMRCCTDRLKEEFTKRTYEGKPLLYPERWEAVVKEVLFRLEETRVVWQNHSQTNTDYESIRADLKGIVEVLGEMKTAIQEKVIRDCVQDLSSGNIGRAINHFKKIGLNSMLTLVTSMAYNEHGKMGNVGNIINFAKTLSNCEKSSVIYITLFYLIQEDNNLNDQETVIFYHEVASCMKNTSIESSLKGRASEIFVSWGNKIRNDDYGKVIEFIKKYYSNIRDYYAEIIENAYASNKYNARSILNFIMETPYIEDEIFALTHLYDVINKNNDLDVPEVLMVAHRLKTVMEMANYPNVRDANQKIADNLRSKFHYNIRRIIWTGIDCTIKNKERREFLYAANNDWAYDSTRRRVFTWRNGDPVTQGFWDIEAENGGEHFSIKNTEHNEYLYAASDRYAKDNDRRTIFTWRPGDKVIQGDWILVPIDGGEYFALKNKAHGEYLFSPDDAWVQDSDRRFVFTSRSSSTYINQEMNWIISC